MLISLSRLSFVAVSMLALQASACAGESNFWPLLVEKYQSIVGRDDTTRSLGPVIARTDKDSIRILSIRPFYTSFENELSGATESYFIYPLANWKERGDLSSGGIMNLVQYRRNDVKDETFFQIFPFVFRYKTPRPQDSYFAFWPFGGVLKNRLFRDKITFAAWPLFVETERGDEVRTHTPYPFIQRLRGPSSRGFGIWPLYGHFERDNDYEHSWAVWPLHYHYRDDLDQSVPYVRFGILPFYHRETAAGLKSESFGWPFFGYTNEWDPRPEYSEQRYFWPFLVQGRGEERYVNRWLPVFSQETSPGREKKWFAWPLLKKERFVEPGLIRDRTTLLYFLYRDEKQVFNDTTARLATVWPLLSYWNDGNGRKQVQALDPLTVFFPKNKVVKENWSPLFALYRFDERSGNARHSVLWDFIVWEKTDDGLQALYIGPIYEWEAGRQWQFMKGLIKSTRTEGERMLKWLWRD